MKLKKLRIRGFKSFDSIQEVDFTKYDSGLVFVTGDNRTEPKLGANGCGKSSIFEALSFCLYGKTSTNLKAGDIKNWFSKEPCEVSIEIDNYEIKRTWNPNSLRLSGKVVTQEVIDRIVGMNFDSFSYSVFISQFGQKFLDFTPTEKLNIFTSILETTLKEWDKYIEYCSLKIKGIGNDKQEVATKIANIEGQLQTLDIQDFKKESEEWEVSKSNKIIELDKTIKDIEEKEGEIITNLSKVLDNTTKIEGNITSLKTKIADEEKMYQKFLDDTSWTKGQIIELSTKIELLARTIDNMTSISGLDNCPTCLQKVNPSIVKKEVKKLLKEEKALESLLTTESIRKGLIDKQADKLKEILSSLKASLSTLEKELGDLAKYETKLTTQKSFLEEEITKHIKTINSLKEEKNPFSDIGTDNKSKTKVLRRMISYKKNDLENLTRDSEIYQYWTKGFKDIKLMLTSEALEELEVEVNNNLQNLGMENWGVKLSIDSETKAGNIKRGFSMHVKSPVNEELVPFDCWSGGEGQRIRIATTLGLSDFIESRRGTNWNILVLDEPTQFLSEQGISDLLKMLREKAKDKDVSIFLIDHRDLNTYGLFSGKLEVVKTDKGSVIWN
jgi:DNA repair exonuclease SbcCD ATPase subunit